MEFETRCHGLQYQGNIANAQEWHNYFFGGYELKELALINNLLLLLENAVALDVGANIGGHSISMSRAAKVVHSFEPYKDLADRIQEQIALNALTNISVHNFGLGENDDFQPYYLDLSSRNSATGSFLPYHTGASQVATLQIRRGDDWCKDKKVDFIKIDVEGFEAPVLAGLWKTLETSQPVIVMEITESSWNLIKEYGGLGQVLPFPYEVFEICNPKYVLGVFQARSYQLVRWSKQAPRKSSFNVLIVPDSRADRLSPIIKQAN